MVDQSGGRHASSVKRPPPAPPRDEAAAASSSSKRQRGPDIREHKIGEDGNFTHNREGIELCHLFQTDVDAASNTRSAAISAQSV